MERVTRKKRTAQFTASNRKGQRFTISQYTEQEFIQTLQSPGEWLDGLTEYCLWDGSPINRISATEFQNPVTGESLYVVS